MNQAQIIKRNQASVRFDGVLPGMTYYCTEEHRIISESGYRQHEQAINERHALMFDNGKVRVTLRFDGVLPGKTAMMVPPEHWLVWVVKTENILLEDGEGNPYPEPKYVPDPDGTHRFREHEEAEAHYQRFLVKYANCFGMVSEETGKIENFRERGNKLGPAEPEVVLGARAVKSEESFGSW